MNDYRCPECGTIIRPQSKYCTECGGKLDVDKAYEKTFFGKIYHFENNEVVRWLYDIVYKKGYGFIKKIISWTKITTPLKAVEKLVKKLFEKFEEHLKNKAKKQDLSEDKLYRIKLILSNEHTIHVVISLLCFLTLMVINFNMAQKTVHIKAEPKIINGENYTVKKKWFSNKTIVKVDGQEMVLRLSLPKYYAILKISDNNENNSAIYSAEDPVKFTCEHGNEYTIDLTYTDDSNGTIVFTVE